MVMMVLVESVASTKWASQRDAGRSGVLDHVVTASSPAAVATARALALELFLQYRQRVFVLQSFVVLDLVILLLLLVVVLVIFVSKVREEDAGVARARLPGLLMMTMASPAERRNFGAPSR